MEKFTKLLKLDVLAQLISIFKSNFCFIQAPKKIIGMLYGLNNLTSKRFYILSEDLETIF